MTRTFLAAAALAALLAVPHAAMAQDAAEKPDAAAETSAGDGAVEAQAEDAGAKDSGAEQAAEPEAGSDPVVAKVNGEKIHRSEVVELHQQLPERLRQMPLDELFPQLVEQLVNRKLMIAKGMEQGLDEDPAVRRQVEEFEQLAVQNAYIDRAIAEGVTEAEIRKVYDEQVVAIEGPMEIRASHILVDSREEAEDLIESAEGGADFAWLAKEHSTGPSSEDGGDLGWFTRSQMVKEFSEAAFAMEPGTVSTEPVETQFGWHVIKVVDKRRQPPPPFEEVRGQIEDRLTRQFVNTHMAELRAKASVEVFDADGAPAGEAPKD